MSSVLSTSTMKSPPLVLCVTGSVDGGMVSAAASRGPGAAALLLTLGGSTLCVLAATGVARAAAPAIVAPLRKLRRPASGAWLRLVIVPSREAAPVAVMAPHRVNLSCKCRAAIGARQDTVRRSNRPTRRAAHFVQS